MFLCSNNSWGPASLQSVIKISKEKIFYLQTVQCWELQIKTHYFLLNRKFKYFFGGLFKQKNKTYIAKINDSQVLYKILNKDIIQNRINMKIT